MFDRVLCRTQRALWQLAARYSEASGLWHLTPALLVFRALCPPFSPPKLNARTSGVKAT